ARQLLPRRLDGLVDDGTEAAGALAVEGGEEPGALAPLVHLQEEARRVVVGEGQHRALSVVAAVVADDDRVARDVVVGGRAGGRRERRGERRHEAQGERRARQGGTPPPRVTTTSRRACARASTGR